MLQTTFQDLTSFNTLGLRSQAAAFVRYESADQLSALSDLADRFDRVFILGGGSNVVLASQLDSLVIKVESRGVQLWSESDSERVVEAQAGEVWHDFVAQCIDRGWDGLENLALIPGTVGAAPVQNIGAYGVELDQRFHSLVAWDLLERRLVEMSAKECRFSYRDSLFKHIGPGRWLIVAVRFLLPKPWRAVTAYPDLQHHPQLERSAAAVTARQIFDAVCEIRRRKLPDPAVLGNAGSFFKNPIISAGRHAAIEAKYPGLVAYPQECGLYKLAAGWLIEHTGWKGRRVGPVGVHDRQALVLVNYGGASAENISGLADAIRVDVAARYGVMLEQEPVIVV